MLRFPTMALKYRSGDEVRAGDQILYNLVPGKIDFVAVRGDLEHAWYVEQCGEGCMILVAPFGNLFVNAPQDDEDLDFVSREQV
jgi:hypothetical protein